MPTQCTCPPADAIPDISAQDCPSKAGNITRLVIGREAGGDFTDITDETEFDTRLAAVDATKIVLTPFLSDVEFPSSNIIETAKDDKSSPFGEGFRTGETSVTVTANLKNLEPSIKDELVSIVNCYSDLNIALVDSNDKIWAIGSTTLIPISNGFVGTRQFGGIDDTDAYTLSFTLRPEWDLGLLENVPTWSPNAK